jgi:hypothetical protein
MLEVFIVRGWSKGLEGVFGGWRGGGVGVMGDGRGGRREAGGRKLWRDLASDKKRQLILASHEKNLLSWYVPGCCWLAAGKAA